MEVSYGVGRPDSFQGIKNRIDVDSFIQKYHVENAVTKEVLREIPVLSYLLGSVTSQPVEKLTNNGTKAQRLLTEGSGLFGLTHPEDAREWKGIFNHVVGASGNAYYIAEKIAHATPLEQQRLIEKGYLPLSVQHINPQKLRDHKLIDHAGRRQADERRRFDLTDAAHPSTHSELNTQLLLHNVNADRFFQNHMKEEDHHFLVSRISKGKLRDIDYAVLTYADWTFDQEPVTLTERFSQLSKRKRAPQSVLDALQAAGMQFESDMNEVFGIDLNKELRSRVQYSWEQRAREGYAASAGVSVTELFTSRQNRTSTITS